MTGTAVVAVAVAVVRTVDAGVLVVVDAVVVAVAVVVMSDGYKTYETEMMTWGGLVFVNMYLCLY